MLPNERREKGRACRDRLGLLQGLREATHDPNSFSTSSSDTINNAPVAYGTCSPYLEDSNLKFESASLQAAYDQAYIQPDRPIRMGNLQPNDQNMDAPTYTDSTLPFTESPSGNRSSVLPECLSTDTSTNILNSNVNKKRLSRRETDFTVGLSSQTQVEREAVHNQDYDGARNSDVIEDRLNSDRLVSVPQVSKRTSPEHDHFVVGYPRDIESSLAIGDSVEVGLSYGAREKAGKLSKAEETPQDDKTFTESFTEVTPQKVTFEFQGNQISIDAVKQNIECTGMIGDGASVQPLASEEDSGYPAPYGSLQDEMGRITIHQPYPGLVGDSNCQDPFPRPALGTASRTYVEPSFEMAIDDSVFPTRHRLETSEDLRAAMMEARRCRYDQPRLEKDEPDRVLGNILSASLQRHHRFPSPNGRELQLKYRHLISSMHRYSFNNWKRDISTRSGQTPAAFNTLETPSSSLTSVEKILQQGCPRCLQFNTSNIYGKPCPCRKFADSHPRVKGGTRIRSTCLRTRKPSSQAEVWKGPNTSDVDRKTRIAEHLKAMESHFGGSVSDLLDCESSERRLNVLLAAAPACVTEDEHLCPASLSQDRPLDSSNGRPDESNMSRGRVHKLSPLKTWTNLRPASRQSSLKMSKQICETPPLNSAKTSLIRPDNGDLANLNSGGENRDDSSESLPLESKRRNRPLRGWEISKLESTLKRCMVEKQKNWRSSKHSLLDEPNLWTLFRI